LKPGYGYVWITNFQEKTSRDLEAALNELEAGEPRLKGLILDLRDNPGGLLNQAIEVSDFFLEQGSILMVKGRQEKNTKIFKANPNQVKRDYPIVVLINAGSASASEIVAGALQDHKRALILGTVSFGKGSVQSVETLRDGYGLKLTIARYYTPNGRSIQAKGIEPDITMKYQKIEEKGLEKQEEMQIKEKDLLNHLNAEPEKGGDLKKEPEKKEHLEKKEIRGGENRYGKLDLKQLESDNQIMRGLEILISYNVFKGEK
jgi:carboxyl-terminal processing protease